MMPAGLSTTTWATTNLSGIGRVPTIDTGSLLSGVPDAPGAHAHAATTSVHIHNASNLATRRTRLLTTLPCARDLPRWCRGTNEVGLVRGCWPGRGRRPRPSQRDGSEGTTGRDTRWRSCELPSHL